MRVLLLGATGNVGSRLLPALKAHGHEAVLFVRSPEKLSREAKAHTTTIVQGSATDRDAIKTAILSNDCDAVVNAAGLAPMLGQSGDLPTIFAAVMQATIEAGDQRGRPLRCWFMSGFASKLAWSLFCANRMDPRSEVIDYSARAGTGAENLVAGTDFPPAWSKTLQWVPLVGTYLNILAQMQNYFTSLEDVADFIAKDLHGGMESVLVGKRVAVKMKARSA
ncbi:uncharacterized protein MYCFIDRAFT_187035 [Pseudocercospora fijiensis CIRAD86]|uniref:NAD(P)-binding domain-containing protein n=1 Tax=Pseudocercospora fijiensis (strain CIRAD86) TaxID=383855 RepID=M3BCT3_PSEFD|nr:uncharacterized protein MYCFIDRAFT_187035 [Pseudocercospora fijiensis CIRAD86]EME87087.1 hypothetical protein MYCFIDRAFT_187035 [Pseudocercospora fijiensis CIRAD86]